MSPDQAQEVLRSQVAADSDVGRALIALLSAAELAAYHAAHGTVDALALNRFHGRAEGIRSIITKVTPVAPTARPGLPPAAADRKTP